MNILLVDSCLPSSTFSGKTVRLKNIYGRLAVDSKVVFLKTQQDGACHEAEELSTWSKKTFAKCITLSRLPQAGDWEKIKTLMTLKPWYDLETKYENYLSTIKKELVDLCRDHEIDVVITFDNETAPFGKLLSTNYPWIQDLGDSMILQIERRLRSKMGWKEKARALCRLLREKSYEEEMAKKAKKTIFVADDDARQYREKFGSRILTIPNGVNYEYFDSKAVSPFILGEPYIVFTGHMKFSPNQDAACYLAKEILPILRQSVSNLNLMIVGADPSDEVLKLRSIPGVTVTGCVPDIRPYLVGAKVFACPMRIGTGIKNKILEAMSMELPIVASSLAIRGIPDISSACVTVADKKADFIGAVLKVVNKKSSSSFGQANRKFVIDRYSWEKTIERYNKCLKQIVTNGHTISD